MQNFPGDNVKIPGEILSFFRKAQAGRVSRPQVERNVLYMGCLRLLKEAKVSGDSFSGIFEIALFPGPALIKIFVLES